MRAHNLAQVTCMFFLFVWRLNAPVNNFHSCRGGDTDASVDRIYVLGEI